MDDQHGQAAHKEIHSVKTSAWVTVAQPLVQGEGKGGRVFIAGTHVHQYSLFQYNLGLQSFLLREPFLSFYNNAEAEKCPNLRPRSEHLRLRTSMEVKSANKHFMFLVQSCYNRQMYVKTDL